MMGSAEKVPLVAQSSQKKFEVCRIIPSFATNALKFEQNSVFLRFLTNFVKMFKSLYFALFTCNNYIVCQMFCIFIFEMCVMRFKLYFY